MKNTITIIAALLIGISAISKEALAEDLFKKHLEEHLRCTKEHKTVESLKACTDRARVADQQRQQDANERERLAQRAQELPREPFAMPEGLPLPKDAKVMFENKPLKGGNSNISFKTKMTIPEIEAFYRAIFKEHGLIEMKSFSGRSESGLNMAFRGWPGGRAISVNIQDEAFRSSEDIRMVSAGVWVHER